MLFLGRLFWGSVLLTFPRVVWGRLFRCFTGLYLHPSRGPYAPFSAPYPPGRPRVFLLRLVCGLAVLPDDVTKAREEWRKRRGVAPPKVSQVSRGCGRQARRRWEEKVGGRGQGRFLLAGGAGGAEALLERSRRGTE